MLKLNTKAQLKIGGKKQTKIRKRDLKDKTRPKTKRQKGLMTTTL